MIAHSVALAGLSPLGTDTSATARPSGMLCTPMASVMNVPCCLPFSPPYETPTPNPSEKACNVMIPTTIITFFAFIPLRSPISTWVKGFRKFFRFWSKILPANQARQDARAKGD